MKKYFSRLGMSYFAGTLIIYAVQLIVIGAVRALCPQWLNNMTIYLILSMLPMYLIGQPAMAFLITRIPAQTIERDRPMTAGQLLAAFCISLAIMYVSNFVGTVITFMIGIAKGSAVQNVLSELVLEADPLVVFVFTVLCAPAAEELLFRKLLADRAVKYGEKTAVLLSGLMFGLFHGNLNQFVYAFTLGMFFAFIYVKTGRIRYTIILHMMVNFMGGVASTLIVKFSNYDELMYAALELQRDPAGDASGFLTAMTDNMGGMMLMSLYSCIVLAIVLTGIILFFMNLKKFRLTSPKENRHEETISAGARLSAVLLNPGMLLFIIFWVVMIVRQLLA